MRKPRSDQIPYPKDIETTCGNCGQPVTVHLKSNADRRRRYYCNATCREEKVSASKSAAILLRQAAFKSSRAAREILAEKQDTPGTINPWVRRQLKMTQVEKGRLEAQDYAKGLWLSRDGANV